MKIRPGIAVLFLFFAGASFTAKAQLEAGIAGGISIPNLTTAGSESNPLNSGYSSRLGPELGLVGEYTISKLFSLEGKIVYSSQGGKKKGLQAFTPPPEVAGYFQQQGMPVPSYLYADYKSEAKLNYLRIPILAKLGWGPRPKAHLRYFVAAGPFVGLLLSAKEVTEGNSGIYMDPAGQQTLPLGSQSFDKSTDIKDQLHTANFGVDGNIGLAYLIGNNRGSKIFLEAGGNYGFVNIQKGAANGKNNAGAATLLLGYTRRLAH